MLVQLTARPLLFVFFLKHLRLVSLLNLLPRRSWFLQRANHSQIIRVVSFVWLLSRIGNWLRVFLLLRIVSLKHLVDVIPAILVIRVFSLVGSSVAGSHIGRDGLVLRAEQVLHKVFLLEGLLVSTVFAS